MRLNTSADDSVNYRYSGILVHPTSFPSPYGIGDFGKGAYDFIDFLEASGQHLWQILPLNPITSHGNSPYQGFSVFAGEPLLISPELLKEQGLLSGRGSEGKSRISIRFTWTTRQCGSTNIPCSARPTRTSCQGGDHGASGGIRRLLRQQRGLAVGLLPFHGHEG